MQALYEQLVALGPGGTAMQALYEQLVALGPGGTAMQALYEQLVALGPGGTTWYQELFVKFYRAFLVAERWKLYLQGLEQTLILTVLALMLGVVLGLVVGVIRTAHDQQRPGKHNPALGLLNLVCKIYTTVIRGTPMVVQFLIMGMVVFASSRNKTMVGVLALGINSGAYVAEIIRGGLMGVDQGQPEASRSLGLNYLDTMRFIVIPQAFKNILPALGNEFIILFKDTSLISVIGGKELLYFAQVVITNTYDPMVPYLGAAFLYLIICVFLTWIQGKLERRLRQSDRR